MGEHTYLVYTTTRDSTAQHSRAEHSAGQDRAGPKLGRTRLQESLGFEREALAEGTRKHHRGTGQIQVLDLGTVCGSAAG